MINEPVSPELVCQPCSPEEGGSEHVLGAEAEEGNADDNVTPEGATLQGLVDFHEEEVQPTNTLRTPSMPSQQDIDLHRLSHLPYRSWCPECVEGFAREWPHKHREIAIDTSHFVRLLVHHVQWHLCT